jgi:tellurite resistance protein TerC
MQKKNSSRMRRVAIAVIGGTVLLFGIALIVLPGPAFLVIPAGLAILATEFAWAGHWLKCSREFCQKHRRKLKWLRKSDKPSDATQVP